MIIVITGPTGVGKTKLSVELAKKVNGEIINADSMQVYKGLNIGTAKIKEEEKDGIPHHLFDICDVDRNYTIYDYQKDCRKVIKEIEDRGNTPILVGGSGLYIKAALYDYEFIEEDFHSEFEEMTNEEILNEIKKDHETDIHVNNRKRLVRELNKIKNGTKNSNKKNDKVYDFKLIGLTTDRDDLYKIIDNRVDIMIKEGLLREVKELYDSNIRTKAVLTPIGYKELFPYFDKEESLDNCLDLIKQRSRRYAKRQYTWFNNQMNINWFNTDYDNFNNTIDEIEKFIGGNL